MEIKTLKTNGVIDIVFENNELVLIDGKEFVRQNIEQRLGTLLGECVLNTELGVPYIEEILGKKRRKSVVENIIKDIILSTPGVIKLDSFTLSFDGINRALTYNFDVNCADGTIVINNEVSI